jgi:hypothetical protein
MTTTGLADFEWWRQRYDADDVGFDEPFADAPWTADTTFLWAKVIEPVRPGVGVPGGFWSIFPHPRVAAGALRFVLLPDWFGAWLERDDWDDDPDGFVSAEDLLAAAENSAPETLRADLPLMREILAGLDALIAQNDGAAACAGLGPVLEKINARWHGTGTWEFLLEVFHGPDVLADEVLARRTEYLGDTASEAQVADALGMTRAAWRELFQRSLADAEARDDVLGELEDDAF